MSELKNSYRQVIKATSIFGGVQVFSIIISIIRSKAIALFIGPIGMGIVGLLNSTIGVVGEFTKLGLDTSAVKEIALANSKDDKKKVTTIISSLRRLVWFTGFFGLLITIILSPLLSEIAFGSDQYITAFVWISIALLFNQLSRGQLAVLQGLRKLSYLAKANLAGGFFGLVLAVPLYYYWRIDAIVPVIIISSFLGLFFSWFFFKKTKIDYIKISNKIAFIEGKEMLKLGVMLSLSGLITVVAAYVFQIYISNYGGIGEVGLFSAGFIIINSYVGLIFNAMRTDYFPRLSAVIESDEKIRKTVVEQALIGILIISPIVTIFLTTAPLVVEVLYSKEFLIITGLVTWGILGTVFKTVSFSIGYVILAKGDSKLFIKTSIFFNSLMLVMNIIGYYYGGLLGVGVSFLIYYFIHYLLLKIITFYRYNLYFDRGFYKVFLICVFLCTITFLVSFVEVLIMKYILMGITTFVTSLYSVYELDKKVDLKEIFKKARNRNK